MAWTTPRTANVSDVFTAAWYNGEIRSNLTFLHDALAITSGATFPASPASGQQHWFVSGTEQRLFLYNGTNWISEAIRASMVKFDTTTATYINYSPASTTPATVYGQDPINVDVAACLAAGMTLQGRITTYTLRTAGADTPKTGLSIASFTAAGVNPGAASYVAGTEATGVGWQSGAWADLVSGSPVAAQIGFMNALVSIGGGATTGFDFHAVDALLRFKK